MFNNPSMLKTQSWVAKANVFKNKGGKTLEVKKTLQNDHV